MPIINGTVKEVNSKGVVMSDGVSYSFSKKNNINPEVGKTYTFDTFTWGPEGKQPVKYITFLPPGQTTTPYQAKTGDQQRSIARSVAVNNVFGNMDPKKLPDALQLEAMLKVCAEIESWLMR